MVTWVSEWWVCVRACRDNLSEMFVHLKFQLNRLSVMHDKRIFISHRKLTIFDSFPVSLYFHSYHYAHTERHTITLLAIQSNNNVQLHEKYPTANSLCLFPRESEWVGVCVCPMLKLIWNGWRNEKLLSQKYENDCEQRASKESQESRKTVINIFFIVAQCVRVYVCMLQIATRNRKALAIYMI